MSEREVVAWLQAADADGLAPRAVQEILAAAVRLYAAKVEAGGPLPPFPPGSGITATEVGLAAGRMLRAADVELFELMIWQGMRDG